MHLVDDIKIEYKDGLTILRDGEDKTIFQAEYCNEKLLTTMIHLYKLEVEHFKNKPHKSWQYMFTNSESADYFLTNRIE